MSSLKPNHNGDTLKKVALFHMANYDTNESNEVEHDMRKNIVFLFMIHNKLSHMTLDVHIIMSNTHG